MLQLQQFAILKVRGVHDIYVCNIVTMLLFNVDSKLCCICGQYPSHPPLPFSSLDPYLTSFVPLLGITYTTSREESSSSDKLMF
jgi:hypothetical protein